VLEGVALGLKAALEVVYELSPVQQLLATGGGARSPIWLQILADILQTELVAPKTEEGAAYGAAILAMVGIGAYADLDSALKLIPHVTQSITPHYHEVYDTSFQRYKALYEALKAIR
jgi:xylulokinase